MLTVTDATIQQLFEARVRQTPSAEAIRHGTEAISFEELNARANRIAYWLTASGARPECLVALLFDRSIDAIAAILGTLKSGAGYVMLDLAWPQSQVDDMLALASPVAAVTVGAHAGRLTTDIPVLRLDAAPDLTAWPGDDPVPRARLDNVAYVAFTSGSTGAPKCVISTHRSILNGLHSVPFEIAPDAVSALNLPLSLGASIAQIFLPLVCGVRLLLLSDSDGKDPRRLAEIIERHKVTTISVVTPVFRQLLGMGAAVTDRLRSLRTLMVGGAAVTSDLIASFATQLPDTTLINGYAASEVGGAAAVSRLTRPAPGTQATVGTPFPNTRVEILNDALQPLPVGDVGDMYIGARHLARGYLGAPGLTASRFVADPYASTPGDRLYRTGDIGRYLPSGEIEYVGRSDDQVKIRGHRVVLGDVERVLHAHEGIREAAVSVQEMHGEPRLVAYIVPAGTGPTVSQLRQFIGERLPDPMVPSVFVTLEALPTTSMGKVDRQALPPAEAIRPETTREYVAPRTPIEQAMARIWADTLGLDRVGIDDDFLELGGDSLLATQIVARIWEAFSLEVPFEALFERPTVSELVAEFFAEAKDGTQIA